jgi:hypothetical protein
MSSSGVKQKAPVNHGVDFWKVPPQNMAHEIRCFGECKDTEVDGVMEKQLQRKLYIGIKRTVKMHVI